MKVFLFAETGAVISGVPDNVEVVSRSELERFAREKRHLLSLRMQRFLEWCETC